MYNKNASKPIFCSQYNKTKLMSYDIVEIVTYSCDVFSPSSVKLDYCTCIKSIDIYVKLLVVYVKLLTIY